MGEYFQVARYTNLVWTLVDSDGSPSGVPEMLVTHGTRFFVIYASPPASERWTRLEKTVRRMVIVMNPWTRNGIHRAASLHPDRPASKTIDDLYHQFGPTPRICIEKPQEDPGMEEYKEDIRSALENLTLQSLRQLSRTTRTLKMDDFSHRLCLISREKLHNVRSWFIVTPITSHMQSRLATRMQTQNIQQQVDMYENFDYHPISRGLSGILFESLGHRFLQQRIIEYAPDGFSVQGQLDESASMALKSPYSERGEFRTEGIVSGRLEWPHHP